jgi:16S rRNA G966 N2-methylase RsmD
LRLFAKAAGFLANSSSRRAQQAAAIEQLHRAVGILRRNVGLYDQRQYSLLSQRADLHSLAGDVR